MEQEDSPMDIDAPNDQEKQDIFLKVEKLYRDNLSRVLTEHANLEKYQLICCSEEEATEIINLGDRIHQTPPYNNLSYYDMYLTLILIYYSLLGEQTEDFLNTRFLNRYAYNKELVKDLYLKLTTGDIMEPNGINLSSLVRRSFFGMRQSGGKKRTKTQKKQINKRKTKRNKRLRRQTNKKNKRRYK
jgi:hypothetical protein